MKTKKQVSLKLPNAPRAQWAQFFKQRIKLCLRPGRSGRSFLKQAFNYPMRPGRSGRKLNCGHCAPLILYITSSHYYYYYYICNILYREKGGRKGAA